MEFVLIIAIIALAAISVTLYISNLKSVLELSNLIAIKEARIKELEDRELTIGLLKEQTLESAKAAIFEIGHKVSSQLIENHKTEAKSEREHADKRLKEAEEVFRTQFQQLTNSVSSLSSKVKESWDTVSTVKNALLNPKSAGDFAEITLENLLKNSGLLEGIDYYIQMSTRVNEDNLRPDLVIFLPNDNILIIDCKASKFFLEAEISADKDNAEKKLIESIRMHLQSFAGKNYVDTVKQYLIKSKIKTNVRNVARIMFLPSEVAVELIHRLDSKFFLDSRDLEILPVGPVGLISLLSVAKLNISEVKQIENYDRIISEVNDLISSVTILAENANKLGGSLQSAIKNYDRFAGSFNSKFLNKVSHLGNLGVKSGVAKRLVGSVKRYQMIESNLTDIVESDIKELTE